MVEVIRFLPRCPECREPCEATRPDRWTFRGWYYECRRWGRHQSGRPLHFRTRPDRPPLVALG